MYCIKKVTNDLTWVGGNDRRLAMFEGVYSVPNGVSYNSYLLVDEDLTVLFDTVDSSISKLFFENIEHVLAGRKLNFVVVQHMEPDHAATLEELVRRYPEITVICNAKIAKMIKQFFTFELDDRCWMVDESSVFKTANHEFHFVFAPMVHWPEVMVTYDAVTKTLFSADAFGTFGALNGAIFADEVDFNHDYMDEARRYYCNIVGKYGPQVQALLKKASGLDIDMVCPLHGFVWRKNIGDFIDKYLKWSSYTPEENGVMIAYASIYGNTANAAEIIAAKLRDRGIKAVVYDVSVTPSSEIIAAAFRWSHLVFASATYNAGIFISMDDLLRDIAAHNLQNRTVAIIENGSWAPTSGKLMKEIISSCKNMTILDESLTILSSLKDSQMDKLEALVDAIAKTVPVFKAAETEAPAADVDANALFKLSYGLYVLSAQEDGKDNGCIVNTVTQLTDTPKRITVAVNKQNLTHDMILRTGKFNVSVLAESVPFDVFKHFGFQSGRDTDKFAGYEGVATSENGLKYLTKDTNAFLSATVIEAQDYGTHTLFVADVTEAAVLSDERSVTYTYYFENIKPKVAKPAKEGKKTYVCKICGYVYEGDELPADYVCPLCKHGAEDFELVEG